MQLRKESEQKCKIKQEMKHKLYDPYGNIDQNKNINKSH